MPRICYIDTNQHGFNATMVLSVASCYDYCVVLHGDKHLNRGIRNLPNIMRKRVFNAVRRGRENFMTSLGDDNIRELDGGNDCYEEGYAIANSAWDYYVAEGGAHCPSRVLNASGQVVEIQEYDPYGRTSWFSSGGASLAGSAVGNPWAWKGHRVDHETALVQMRNRYYLPLWGRFLTDDPLGGWTDRANLGNGLTYASENPLTHSDPFGLQTLAIVVVPSREQRAAYANTKKEEKGLTALRGYLVQQASDDPNGGVYIEVSSAGSRRVDGKSEDIESFRIETIRRFPPKRGGEAPSVVNVIIGGHGSDGTDARPESGALDRFPQAGARALVRFAALWRTLQLARGAIDGYVRVDACHGAEEVPGRRRSIAGMLADAVGRPVSGVIDTMKLYAWPRWGPPSAQGLPRGGYKEFNTTRVDVQPAVRR